jgi:hypothetical protein
MFNFRPYVPGFNVKPPADAEVPGFRMNPDGSVRTDGAASSRPPSYTSVGWTPNANDRYVNSPRYPGPLGASAYPDASILEKIRVSDWLVPRFEAAMDGAISTIPGAWNAIRAIGRAAGMGGKDEAHRFDEEMKAAGNLAGKVVDKVVEHPQQAARVADEVWSR